MNSNELLATFRQMSENRQNKIIIESFRQIADTHTLGLSLDHFTWRDCTLDCGKLKFNVGRKLHLTPITEARNLTDYAGVIYCLATGKSSTESMGWDAGRKIGSAVLREIVLTLNGRNDTTRPLISKLMQPYIDEDTFFSDYVTVDEKEASEAYERQRRVDEARRQEEARSAEEEKCKKALGMATSSRWFDGWWTKSGYLLLVVAIVGCVKACKITKSGGVPTRTVPTVSRHLPAPGWHSSYSLPMRNLGRTPPTTTGATATTAAARPVKSLICPKVPDLKLVKPSDLIKTCKPKLLMPSKNLKVHAIKVPKEENLRNTPDSGSAAETTPLTCEKPINNSDN